MRVFYLLMFFFHKHENIRQVSENSKLNVKFDFIFCFLDLMPRVKKKHRYFYRLSLSTIKAALVVL